MICVSSSFIKKYKAFVGKHERDRVPGGGLFEVVAVLC